MLYILRQFLHPSFMQCENNQSYFVYEKEVSITEEYFERGKSLTGLKYNKGGIFLNGNKRIDCSGLPIVFGDTKGFRDKDTKRMNTNSYKLFLLGKEKSNFDIQRGDTLFFLPQGTGSYHIAFAVGPKTGMYLKIFDFFSEIKQGKMSERTIRLKWCGGYSYCYMNRRILVRTNIFEEQKLLSINKSND